MVETQTNLDEIEPFNCCWIKDQDVKTRGKNKIVNDVHAIAGIRSLVDFLEFFVEFIHGELGCTTRRERDIASKHMIACVVDAGVGQELNLRIDLALE